MPGTGGRTSGHACRLPAAALRAAAAAVRGLRARAAHPPREQPHGRSSSSVAPRVAGDARPVRSRGHARRRDAACAPGRVRIRAGLDRLGNALRRGLRPRPGRRSRPSLPGSTARVRPSRRRMRRSRRPDRNHAARGRRRAQLHRRGARLRRRAARARPAPRPGGHPRRPARHVLRLRRVRPLAARVHARRTLPAPAAGAPPSTPCSTAGRRRGRTSPATRAAGSPTAASRVWRSHPTGRACTRCRSRR